MAHLLFVQQYQCLHFPIQTSFTQINKKYIEPPQYPYWQPPFRKTGICNLNKLLRDMSFYHIETHNDHIGHSGDLLDHSIWTYYLLVSETSKPQIFQSWFIRCIPQEYYVILQIGGLLHDVGKAGDRIIKYEQKPDHPLQSWFYFQGTQRYIWIDGDKIPFRQYLSENCTLSSAEWDLIGIIAALHYDLGNLFSNKISMDHLIDRLMSHINMTHIPFDPLMVFRLVRAVCFSDVWAQRPVEYIEGYVQIDPEINIQQRREFTQDNWNKYFDIDKFLLTCRIEDILKHQLTNNKKIIHSYVYNPNGDIKLKEPMNLILVNTKNIQRFNEDPNSPYQQRQEYTSYICESIFNLDKQNIRKDIIREIITCIEMYVSNKEILDSNLKEAQCEIYKWYYSITDNLLSTNSILNLVQRLQKYPRKNWSNQYIQMQIGRLISPTYNIKEFIKEYDKEYYEQELEYNKDRIQMLMDQTKILKFKYLGTAFSSWEDLIELMSKDDSFEIPILSPKGLLLILDLFIKLNYEHPIIDNMVNVMNLSLLKYFDPKYNIHGLYVNKSKIINIQNPI